MIGVFRFTILLFVLVVDIATVLGQSGWRESFETGQPSWQDAGGNRSYRLLHHERIANMGRSGGGCEWLQIECSGEQGIYFSHNVGQPRIIDELTVSLWVKSDRAGVTLALRVALPRTIDSRSGRPTTTILTSEPYSDVGRWQQLQISRTSLLLSRHIRALRMQLGPQVDGREAYVDAVLLNIPGGPVATNVFVDDLEIYGYVPTVVNGQSGSRNMPQSAGITVPGLANGTPTLSNDNLARLPPVPVVDLARLPPVEKNPVVTVSASTSTTTSAPRRIVKLAGSVLSVDGRPLFPRIIQHRGEPLAFLKRLGFNVVLLQRVPAPEMLEEADRLDLWLICPPPKLPTPGAEIGPAFDPVLAWHLGSELTENDMASIRNWTEEIHNADRRMSRPLVCLPRAELRGYSRIADLLIIDRRPLGTSTSMNEYAAWVRNQPLLARPGTSVWTTVQTQPSESLRQQIVAFEPGLTPPLAVAPEQIRLLAYTAVAAGSRGLIFLSDSPLDASDAETQQRAMTLELLNLELDLLTPWAAAGSFVAQAESNVPDVQAAVLRTEYARLLLPIWSSALSQCVPPSSACNLLSLTAPGVPESAGAYQLTPNGVRPLQHKRVAGGMLVNLEDFNLTDQILLAHDAAIIAAVNRRAAEIGRRAAELERNLAVHKFHTVQQVVAQISQRTAVSSAQTWFASAARSLQECDRLLKLGDAPGTVKAARQATQTLRQIERAYWDATVSNLDSPVTSPGTSGFYLLPFHWRLVDRLASCRFGSNRLAGGDFEDIDMMIRSGWQYTQRSSATLKTSADLMPKAARSGRFGLRLAVEPVDPKHPPAAIEAPPVVFTSPAVSLEAGQILCIYGWVRVPKTITASTDGLMIVDSLSGEALADRITRTDGWRRFTLYRAAPQSGTMCVSFVLTGIGEAWIDDVILQVVEGQATLTQR